MMKTMMAILLMGVIVLAGCQQTPAPVQTVEPPASTQPSGDTAYPYPAVVPQVISGPEAYPLPEGIEQAPEITWEEAQQHVLNLEVAQVMQGHDLTVYLLLKDGRQFKTVEPAIDEIFGVIQTCGDPCGDIILATE